MASGLFYSEQCLRHLTGLTHPEKPARLEAIMRGLAAAGLLDRLARIEGVAATDEQILRVHDALYLQRLHEARDDGRSFMDSMDTPICDVSLDVARIAAGGAVAAVEAVMGGAVRNAFCAVRPPGHHAERSHAMGFCLLNHIAIAAAHLREAHGLDRVAVIDFDVHHGNGTQHIFEADPRVFFVSIHEDPARQYPGTGHAWEIGMGDGEGTTLNVPMPPRSGDMAYQAAFEQRIFPTLATYGPQFILISAGFDAAAGDTLGHMELTPDGFEWITREICRLASHHGQGWIVSLLEGGYNLEILPQCVNAHVRALIEAAEGPVSG